MQGIRCLYTMAFTAALLFGNARSVAAFDPSACPQVEDSELAQQRGGFRLAGLDINFGAQMQTYLNGDLVLQTTVQWSSVGTSVQQMSGTLQPMDAAALQNGILSGGNLQLGNATVYLANGGQTALVQQATPNLQNILLNTASNIAVRQRVDATLSVGGYAPLNAQSVGAQMSSQAQAMIAATLLAGVIG